MTFNEKRQAMNLTIREMADVVGFSPRTVEAWCQDMRKPPECVEIILELLSTVETLQNEVDHLHNRLKK